MRLIQLGLSQGYQSKSNILSFYLCFRPDIMDVIEKQQKSDIMVAIERQGAVICATANKPIICAALQPIYQKSACMHCTLTWDCKVTVAFFDTFSWTLLFGTLFCSHYIRNQLACILTLDCKVTVAQCTKGLS